MLERDRLKLNSEDLLRKNMSEHDENDESKNTVVEMLPEHIKVDEVQEFADLIKEL